MLKENAMHGLVSLLPEPFYEYVQAVWKHLEDEFGLKGIRVTPYPHLSWQIGQNYSLAALEKKIKDVCRETSSFEIRTTGLGVFTGPKPVIYIQVVKSPSLYKLHETIWGIFSAYGEEISPLYRPDLWTPHISLAYEDVTEENIEDVMAWLSRQNLSWQMNIDNLAFIYEPPGKIGELKFHFFFKR
jgi:hypothetical protein